MDKEILTKAIETYGPNNQLLQGTEECAEFIQAVNKYHRAKNLTEKANALKHLAEEVADCIIMMEQARLIVGANRVDEFILQKQFRLAKNLEKEAQNG